MSIPSNTPIGSLRAVGEPVSTRHLAHGMRYLHEKSIENIEKLGGKTTSPVFRWTEEAPFLSSPAEIAFFNEWVGLLLQEHDPAARVNPVTAWLAAWPFGIVMKAVRERLEPTPYEEVRFPYLKFPTPIGAAIYDLWPNFPREKDGVRDSVRAVLDHRFKLVFQTPMRSKPVGLHTRAGSLQHAMDCGNLNEVLNAMFGDTDLELKGYLNQALYWSHFVPAGFKVYRPASELKYLADGVLAWGLADWLPEQLPMHQGKLVYLNPSVGYGYHCLRHIGKHHQVPKLPPRLVPTWNV